MSKQRIALTVFPAEAFRASHLTEPEEFTQPLRCLRGSYTGDATGDKQRALALLEALTLRRETSDHVPARLKKTVSYIIPSKALSPMGWHSRSLR